MKDSFFSSLIRSCTDFKFYREKYLQSFGKTLRYLLFLSLLVTAILGIRYGAGFSKFIKESMTWIEKNAPYIEINEGIVKADVEQPYIRDEKEFILIIDTTDQVKAIDQKYKTGVLLTKDRLIIKNNEIRTQEFDLKKVKSFKLDKGAFIKLRKFFIFILIPFMIIVQFVYFFVMKIVQSLVTSLVILIAKPAFKFVSVMNLCIYAVTPVSVLAILVMFTVAKPLPYFPFIYLGMYVAFILGAIKQILLDVQIPQGDLPK